MKTKEYTHPDCDHDCTSDCRREGCNCLCGEWHGTMSFDELQEALINEIRETKIGSVKMILMKYCVLKSQYDGMMCYELAAKIVDAVCDTPEILPVPTTEELELEAKRLTQPND